MFVGMGIIGFIEWLRIGYGGRGGFALVQGEKTRSGGVSDLISGDEREWGREELRRFWCCGQTRLS